MAKTVSSSAPQGKKGDITIVPSAVGMASDWVRKPRHPGEMPYCLQIFNKELCLGGKKVVFGVIFKDCAKEN